MVVVVLSIDDDDDMMIGGFNIFFVLSRLRNSNSIVCRHSTLLQRSQRLSSYTNPALNFI